MINYQTTACCAVLEKQCRHQLLTKKQEVQKNCRLWETVTCQRRWRPNNGCWRTRTIHITCVIGRIYLQKHVMIYCKPEDMHNRMLNNSAKNLALTEKRISIWLPSAKQCAFTQLLWLYSGVKVNETVDQFKSYWIFFASETSGGPAKFNYDHHPHVVIY